MAKPKEPLLPPDHPLREPLASFAVKALRHHLNTNDPNSYELFERLVELATSERQGPIGHGDAGPVVQGWYELVRNAVEQHGDDSNPDRARSVALAVLTQLQFSPFRLLAPQACTTESLVAYLEGRDGFQAERCRAAIESVATQIESTLRGPRDAWTAVKVARKTLRALGADSETVRLLPWPKKSRDQRI